MRVFTRLCKILGCFCYHYSHILRYFLIYLLQDDSKLGAGCMKQSLNSVLCFFSGYADFLRHVHLDCVYASQPMTALVTLIRNTHI